MEDPNKALREKICWLSFRWESLRDRADFLEHLGEDIGNLRELMFQLQVEITNLKGQLASMEALV